MTDRRKHAAVERLVPVAEQAGVSLTHLALAVVAPGTDLGAMDVAHVPAALTEPEGRRRGLGDRAAA
ncbi:hypothetical protein [Dactylosporangium sp. NPDC051541]|uniref:hypothetical protein n=1 Tax=Dactylosporangium sp. NPDC051541 TaxID=3363977 RepID=UPI00379AEEF0